MTTGQGKIWIRKAGSFKTAVFLLIILFIIALFWLFWHGIQTTKITNKPLNTSQQPQANSPDQVKEKYGPNGDTSPSPTGTAPGGNNSLLSQP